VFQILAEIGVAAAIAGKPVGQQSELRRHCFKKDPSSAPVAAGARRCGITGEEPVLALDGVPMLSLRFFGAGTFSTAATTRLLSGLAVLRPGLVGSPRPPMKVSSASRKPCSDATDPRSAVAQLVRHGPGRLIRHTSSRCRKLGRNPALIAAIR